jgi:hypothetical protein
MNSLNFIVYAPQFKANVGGHIALYNLASIISEYNINCKLFDSTNSKIPNNVFDDYAMKSDINDNTVVIYPEIISDNPLQAKYVVRWILCELGINCSENIYKTWDKNDFVYHFSSYNPNENIEQYNILSPFYLSSELINYNKPREGYCYIIRKGYKFHRDLTYIHPPDSLCLDDDLSQENLIFILNRKEYIISYDPYSFISFMAALCGCISIVLPIEGYSKEQWFKSLSISKFLSQAGVNELKGIAYGIEEIGYAKKTLKEVHEQQQIVRHYGEETVHRFINDMLLLTSETTSLNILPRNNNILRVQDLFPQILNYDKLADKLKNWKLDKKKLFTELKIIIKQLLYIYVKIIQLKLEILIKKFYYSK